LREILFLFLFLFRFTTESPPHATLLLDCRLLSRISFFKQRRRIIMTRSVETRRAFVWLVLLVSLAPTLAAVWSVPWFVTQDGPAHLYNAQVIRASLGADSTYHNVYEVRWTPLPNWMGHLVLAGLLEIISIKTANRIMMTFTLVGVAASALWWRMRVAGPSGSAAFALLSALLAMNIAWMYGFWSFLLGTALFSVTLAVWWTGREHFSARRALLIAALLTAGYFCHIVSLGLTLGGLATLAAFEPATNSRRRRLRAWTVASAVPVLPLIAVYQRLMRGHGQMTPTWEELKNPLSLASWRGQLGWVEPISLFGKTAAPFVEGSRPWFAGLSPLLWLVLAIVALLVGVAKTDRKLLRDRLGLFAVAGGLLAGGLFGPDSLGANHGNYLALRLVLLALIASVPAWPYACRTATIALALAVALQSAFIWDAAIRSNRAVGPIVAARSAMQPGDRMGTLLIGARAPTRSSPLLHADCLLGAKTGAIVWANYESAFYYFPVQVRPAIPHPPILEFEEISRMDDPSQADARADRWRRLLLSHAAEVDTVMVWAEDIDLDRYGFGPFKMTFHDGPVRILRRRPADSLTTDLHPVLQNRDARLKDPGPVPVP